jgi:hypothetical protein
MRINVTLKNLDYFPNKETIIGELDTINGEVIGTTIEEKIANITTEKADIKTAINNAGITSSDILSEIADQITEVANIINISNLNLTAADIESFYTMLPIGTQIINVKNNTGSLTADHTIATLKGYTVVYE